MKKYNSIRSLLLTLLFLSLLGQASIAIADVECDPNGVTVFTSGANYYMYCVAPASNHAGGSAKNTENRIYSGFVWELFGEQGMIPDFVIGVRSLQVKSNDNVNGADASFRIKFKDQISADSWRISYVGGERAVMGNVGVGYSLTQSSWLGTAAIQAPYVRVSADYLVSENKFKYFAELNTLDKPSNVPQVTRPLADGTCPSTPPIKTINSIPYPGNPYVLTQVIDGAVPSIFIDINNPTFTVDPSQIVDGKTCFSSVSL